MGKILSIIGGTAAAILGLLGLINWWYAFVELLKGSVPCFLILGGLIALFAGVSELKDELAAKKEEKK
jgi:succinate-acetate transporter protein